MKVTIEAIKNGFVVSLQNPMSPPESFFVRKWEEVLKMITGLQISDTPPVPPTKGQSTPNRN